MNIETLKKIQSDFLTRIFNASTTHALENIELELVGRKLGIVTGYLKAIKDLTAEEKRTIGPQLNALKGELQTALLNKKAECIGAQSGKDVLDATEPYVNKGERGTLHPVTIIQNELEDLFTQLGYLVLDGPELESEYYNFESLNIPADHPARDMQDTFYVENHPGMLMRTQTSTMQVRAMRMYGSPLRAIVPGRCFRNEATDARHDHTFYQLEGFVVGNTITFSHLKGILEATAHWLYGAEAHVRLRPKCYPFVEPGVSGEVTCMLCEQKGCRVCKQTGFLEIFGAGLIHPHVLREGGYDPKIISGFAFGFGLTRLAMLKYGITDIRRMHGSDISFLKQF